MNSKTALDRFHAIRFTREPQRIFQKGDRGWLRNPCRTVQKPWNESVPQRRYQRTMVSTMGSFHVANGFRPSTVGHGHSKKPSKKPFPGNYPARNPMVILRNLLEFIQRKNAQTSGFCGNLPRTSCLELRHGFLETSLLWNYVVEIAGPFWPLRWANRVQKT